MIAGVRMRLAVTVWKITVAVAIAAPTMTSAASFSARSARITPAFAGRPSPR